MGGRGEGEVESRGGGEKKQGAGAAAAGDSPESTQVVLHCFPPSRPSGISNCQLQEKEEIKIKGNIFHLCESVQLPAAATEA